METACRERFGEARAWSRDRIIRYWKKSPPVVKGKPSRIDTDAEIREFVEDRLGRLTLGQLAAACREAFGPKRAPSRSAIHRHSMKLRRRPK